MKVIRMTIYMGELSPPALSLDLPPPFLPPLPLPPAPCFLSLPGRSLRSPPPPWTLMVGFSVTGSPPPELPLPSSSTWRKEKYSILQAGHGDMSCAESITAHLRDGNTYTAPASRCPSRCTLLSVCSSPREAAVPAVGFWDLEGTLVIPPPDY